MYLYFNHRNPISLWSDLLDNSLNPILLGQKIFSLLSESPSQRILGNSINVCVSEIHPSCHFPTCYVHRLSYSQSNSKGLSSSVLAFQPRSYRAHLIFHPYGCLWSCLYYPKSIYAFWILCETEQEGGKTTKLSTSFLE